MNMGMIPVLYGVPCFDRQQSCSILSGDDIIVYLAKKLGAKKIIHATDVDGVFTADPKKCDDAKFIKHINSQNFEKLTKGVGGSSVTDVTGGMERKIRDLLSTGSRCEMINGNKKGLIERTLGGEKGLGTVISP